MKWEITGSKYLVNDKWLKLRADSCKMPNGNIVEPYYVFEYSPWVNVLGITEKNEVLLVKQYRHGIQDIVLELPGGCVDEGETVIDAVKRELLEETGYTGNSFTQTCIISANPSSHTNKTHCFLATGLVKLSDPSFDESEDIETVAVPMDKFIEMFKQNEFQQALHIGTIFYGLIRLKESGFNINI